eukprot:13290275-Ditylum_brightwellii.AAC.1
MLWRTRELWTSTLRSTVSNNAGVLHNLLREWFPTTKQQWFQFNPENQSCYGFQLGQWYKHKSIK